MRRFDILILGLGPAGTVLAVHLQRLGYRVALAGEIRRRAAYEGLAPRTIEGLRRAGLEQAQQVATVEALRTASWNGVTSAANREFLVDRLSLDRALLDDCLSAQIPVIRGRIGAVERLSDGWRAGIGNESLSGDFLVEARGRRAPARGNIALRGPASLALARKFELGQPAQPQTFLASYRDGWTWLCLSGGTTAHVQIVISGQRPELAAKTTLEALFTAELEKIPEIHARLGRGALPNGPVMARDASALLRCQPAGAHGLAVGDAAFAIDPLSGHGNFEAVGGAMAAAAVINTLRQKPENRDLALAFYGERAKSAFLRHARVGRDFYRMEQRWPEAPFWHERQDWPDNLPAHETAAARPRIKPGPVIENGLIVERNIIITADQPRGIRMVDGVPVAELLAGLEGSEPEALARRFNVSPAQIETALKWLRYHGLLPDQESRRSAP